LLEQFTKGAAQIDVLANMISSETQAKGSRQANSMTRRLVASPQWAKSCEIDSTADHLPSMPQSNHIIQTTFIGAHHVYACPCQAR
jgi:hypothetical protein